MRCRRSMGWLGAIAFFVALAMGCGDDDPRLSLPLLAPPEIDLVINGTFSLTVALNRPATRPVVVRIEVEPAFAGAVNFSTTSIDFAVGDVSHVVGVTGLASTNSSYATVTFTLVDEKESTRTWRVRVDEPSP